jgi:hypothetical protein
MIFQKVEVMARVNSLLKRKQLVKHTTLWDGPPVRIFGSTLSVCSRRMFRCFVKSEGLLMDALDQLTFVYLSYDALKSIKSPPVAPIVIIHAAILTRVSMTVGAGSGRQLRPNDNRNITAPPIQKSCVWRRRSTLVVAWHKRIFVGQPYLSRIAHVL